MDTNISHFGGNKKGRRLTVQDLLDLVEELNIPPTTQLHVTMVSEHSPDGDWHTGSDVSQVAYYGTGLTVRGSCNVCG